MDPRPSTSNPQPIHHSSNGPRPPALPPPPLPTEVGNRSGQLLNGRYRLVRLIEKNVAGWDLYQVMHVARQKPCTVKIMRPGAEASHSAERRLLRETEVLSRVAHPNIAEVREFNHDQGGTPYLVMEPLCGRSLHRLLAETGPMNLQRSLQILRGIGKALQHLHDLGLVHGNLKLSSVFLHQDRRTEDGHVDEGGAEQEAVKLLNFELARDFEAGQPTGVASVPQKPIVERPTQLPPDALSSERAEVDKRSDQWALAVIACRMFSGRLPFANENPDLVWAQVLEREAGPLQELLPPLPVAVLRAISTALAQNKDQRHSSITEFLRALEYLPPRGLRQPSQPNLSSRSDRTLRCFRADLVALCRQNTLVPEPVPVTLDEQQDTQPYPADSFVEKFLDPAELEAQRSATALEARRVSRHWAPSLAIGLMALATGVVGQSRLREPVPVRAYGTAASAPVAPRPVVGSPLLDHPTAKVAEVADWEQLMTASPPDDSVINRGSLPPTPKSGPPERAMPKRQASAGPLPRQVGTPVPVKPVPAMPRPSLPADDPADDPETPPWDGIEF